MIGDQDTHGAALTGGADPNDTATGKGRVVDNNEPITEHGLFWLRDNEQ